MITSQYISGVRVSNFLKKCYKPNQFSLMKFLQIFLVSLFLILPTYNSFADEEVIDPDLKLSIEELKKKYPIDWFEKKYGNYLDNGCEGGDFEGEVNAVCLFFYDRESLNQFLEENHKSIFIKKSATTEQILDTLSAKFLDVFNELDESQIKSIIVHYNQYSYEVRVRDIINIMLSQIVDTGFLHENKKKIKNFFYSEVIASSTKLSCVNMKNIDPMVEFYDTFAINYLKQFLNPPILTSIDSAAKLCIHESRLPQIKELLNQP
jgi:hypothetical protein